VPLLLFILSWLLLCPSQADPRRLVDAQSPDWLQAVGQLTVPGHRFVDGERQHHLEDCSATLIGPTTILTAWHCLEFYGDLSREILFRLPPLAPIAAHRLADGGGMSADWALLRLAKPVTGVTPVRVNKYFPALDKLPVSIAGYSGDSGLGANGEQLTWQEDCQITANEWFRVATDCLAYKGASGGPAIAEGTIIGVISAGDGVSLTYYTPSSTFNRAVRLHRR